MPRKPRDKDVDNDAAAIARAAWEVKPGEVSVQFRARIAKEFAEEMVGQKSWERGDVWSDGVRVRRSLPKLIKAIDQLTPLQAPSYIINPDSVTVVWGQWSATGSTTVEAVLLLLEEVFPDE